MLVIFLFPVAGVACACKKEATTRRRMDVLAKRGDRVEVGAVLLRMEYDDCSNGLRMNFGETTAEAYQSSVFQEVRDGTRTELDEECGSSFP
jgi:hypothetical protein